MIDKERALRIIKLLSALECAGLMSGKLLPDYLYDDISAIIEELSAEILK
jgi:hypothetical protein